MVVYIATIFFLLYCVHGGPDADGCDIHSHIHTQLFALGLQIIHCCQPWPPSLLTIWRLSPLSFSWRKDHFQASGRNPKGGKIWCGISLCTHVLPWQWGICSSWGESVSLHTTHTGSLSAGCSSLWIWWVLVSTFFVSLSLSLCSFLFVFLSVSVSLFLSSSPPLSLSHTHNYFLKELTWSWTIIVFAECGNCLDKLTFELRYLQEAIRFAYFPVNMTVLDDVHTDISEAVVGLLVVVHWIGTVTLYHMLTMYECRINSYQELWMCWCWTGTRNTCMVYLHKFWYYSTFVMAFDLARLLKLETVCTCMYVLVSKP